MEKADLKEHYVRDIQFHLRCAKESVEKQMGELDPRNVEDIVEMAIAEERILLINAVMVHGN